MCRVRQFVLCTLHMIYANITLPAGFMCLQSKLSKTKQKMRTEKKSPFFPLLDLFCLLRNAGWKSPTGALTLNLVGFYRDLQPGACSVLVLWTFLQPFNFGECTTKHQLWQEAQSFLGTHQILG